MQDEFKNKIQDESGQVVVEYTMLIAVIVTLIITVFGIIKERFVADDNCGAQTLNPVCAISGAYSDPTFRRFPVRR